MKILLAYKSHPEGARDPFTSLLPVGLLSLHAVARTHGHDSILANLSGFSWKEVRALLAREKPGILGISQFTHNRHESLKLARLAKELDPNCTVVLGGAHATHTALETLSDHACVDAVVLGEGEETLAELVGTLERGGDLAQVAGLALRGGDGPCRTAARQPVRELDALPSPYLHTEGGIGVDWRRQLEFIITSRGCPASCLFCSSPLFWGRGVRFRSPRSIVEEIRFLQDNFGLLYFSFRDDTFTADRERVLELCRLFEEEKLHILWNCQSRVTAVDREMLLAMKKGGCECIQFGVESGSPALLRALGKRITPEQVERAAQEVRRVGINLSVYLITGIPGEGEGELQETLRLVERMRAQDGQVSPLVYYPGTQLFLQAVRRGEVPPTLFDAKGEEGFLVRRDPFVERSRAAILKGLEKSARKGRYSTKELLRQRELPGPTLVSEMLFAEALEEDGDWEGASRVYRDLVRREPDNPWGWLLLGGLLARSGELQGAKRGYLEVVKLVPRHLPAFLELGALELELGRAGEARGYFRRALELDPGAATALEGMRVTGG